jgi:hypothetical protein
MRPRYARIEFCRNADTLWDKIKSGRYDWIGVHPEGQFIVGSPPLGSGPTMRVAPELIHRGAEAGRHGVLVEHPIGRAGGTWYASEDDAKAAFLEKVKEEKAGSDGPVLKRVYRVEDGEERESEVIVVRAPNYPDAKSYPGPMEGPSG